MVGPVKEISQRLLDLATLSTLCPQMEFVAGEIMRLKGQHYREMFILAVGSADVDRAGDGGDGPIEVYKPGTPIG